MNEVLNGLMPGQALFSLQLSLFPPFSQSHTGTVTHTHTHTGSAYAGQEAY